MNLTNHYYYFKSAIDSDTCQKIIDLGLAKLQSEKDSGINVEAYTAGNGEKSSNPGAIPQGELSKRALKSQGVGPVYVRDSEVTWLNQKWLYELFYPFIAEANQKAEWNWQWDCAENFQFTVYNPGQFYSWHKDGISDHTGAYKRYIHGITDKPISPRGNFPDNYVIDPNFVGKVRKISMTVNLNAPNAYEGGDLKFDFGNHTESEQYHLC
jgi:hypothetical protein